MTTERIRTLVVDDEPLAREGLRLLLAADPEVSVVGEAGNGPEAVRLIREQRPDLVLLDVQMPELNGFEVLAHLAPTEVPAVIFVTAYDRYALRAFDIHALDYLLKPFRDDRFHDAVGRAKAQIRLTRMSDLSQRVEERLPIFLVAVVAMSYLLLMVLFRSILVPRKFRDPPGWGCLRLYRR